MSRCVYKIVIHVNKGRPDTTACWGHTTQDLVVPISRNSPKSSWNRKDQLLDKVTNMTSGGYSPRGYPRGGLPPYQRLINSENGKITLSMDGFGVKIWGSAGNFGVFGLQGICQKSQKSAQATLDSFGFLRFPHKVLGFFKSGYRSLG